MEILQSLGYLSGLAVGLCAVFLFLVWPALLLFAVFSALRSLRRIADSLDQTTTGSMKTARRQLAEPLPVVVSGDRRVSNSMFGR